MSNKLIVLSILYILINVISLNPNQAKSNDDIPQTILISIDGLRPDLVINLEKSKVKLPFLREFLKKGSFASGVIGVIPTLTYPSHTTILNGVDPGEHGIYANITFDPFNKHPNEWYWYAQENKVKGLWDIFEENKIKTMNISWPVSIGAQINYNVPEYFRYEDERDLLTIEQLATPGLLQELKSNTLKSGQTYPVMWSLDDDLKRLEAFKYLLRKKTPTFSTLYLGAYDGLAHKLGFDHPKALSILEIYDSALKEIWEEFDQKSKNNFIFTIVSDHGFSNVKQGISLNSLFFQKGWISLDKNNPTKVKNYKVYAWESHGSVGLIFKDEQDKVFQNQVIQEIKKYVGPDKYLKHIYSAQDLPAYTFEKALWVVESNEDTTIDEAPINHQIIRKKHKYKATHGFHPSRTSMHASFFIRGKNIKQAQNLGLISMKSIAPSIASIYKLKLNATKETPLDLLQE